MKGKKKVETRGRKGFLDKETKFINIQLNKSDYDSLKESQKRKGIKSFQAFLRVLIFTNSSLNN